MPKLSDFKSDQIEVVSVPQAAQTAGNKPALKISDFHPDEIELITSPGDMKADEPKGGLLDRAASAVEGAGGYIMDSKVGKGLAWVGDKLERYVDAPFRAGIGNLQQHDGNLIDAGLLAMNQFGESELPSTPSARKIMARAGVSEKSASEAFPGAFSESGEGIKLKKGGILDVTPAGIAGGAIQPSMWAIPGEQIIGAATKGAGAVAKGAAKVASPLAETVARLNKGAQSGLFKAGEVLTGGNLNAAKASKAASNLSGYNLLFPGSENFGALSKAGKEIGEARKVISDAGAKDTLSGLTKAKEAAEAAGIHGGMTAEEAAKLVPHLPVTGSQEALHKVRDIIVDGEKRALRTPGSQAVLEKIDNLIESGADVPLQTIDDLVRNLDNVGFTPAGNARSLDPMWKGPVSQARGELNTLLSTLDEGKALQKAKDKYANLSTAAKGRSKLMEGLSNLGAVSTTGALATGLATGNPAIIATAAIAAGVAKAMSPRTYFQIVGVSKLPADGAKLMMKAYESGSVTAIRNTIADLSKKYPEEIARLTSAIADRQSPGQLPSVSDKEKPKNNAIERRLGH